MADVAALCQRSAGDSFFLFTKRCLLNEMKNFISRRELPAIEKTSSFFKFGSRQILTNSKNRHEQIPLIWWESLLDSTVSKLKAEINKGLKCYTKTKDSYPVVGVVP